MKTYLRIIPAVLVAAFLAACGIPATPIVSEFNGDSVTIVTSSFADQSSVKKNAQAEASRICAKGPKKRAEYASTRTNQQTYEQSHLYLCLD
tara:strand:+ start:3416 stop:3691 length:276 start_codon:yes stop_codon:yes gene_type:complete